VVLGMGEDGHTASLFPGADNLAAALAPKNGQLVMAIRAPGAPQPRLTLTLPALLDARNLLSRRTGQAPRL
jgi:6-phosphogluconolactonase